MEHEIQTFSNTQFGQLRQIDVDGEPWFIAADPCRVLEHTNVTMALSRLDDDEKAKLNLGLAGGETNIVSFPGLLNLILSSRKPEAKAYRRWVTHEVLPAIHRDGGYMAPRDETPEETMARALLIADRSIRELGERNRCLERRVQSLRPKALVGEAVEPSAALYTLPQVTKLLQNVAPSVRMSDVKRVLRDSRMMCRCSREPTHDGIKTGRLAAVYAPYTDRDGVQHDGVTYSRVTGKGLAWLVGQFAGQAQAAML